MSSYVPDRGDLVWLEFTPQAGSEQRGRRPALVLSPKSYNGKVGLALFCPVTSKVKGYPFEVELPEGYDVSGVVLSDQLKSLDWRSRKARLIDRVPCDVIAMVIARVLPLVEPTHLQLSNTAIRLGRPHSFLEAWWLSSHTHLAAR